jgi:TRAP-type C4-dicarboxylate transport system permease small subunit
LVARRPGGQAVLYRYDPRVVDNNKPGATEMTDRPFEQVLRVERIVGWFAKVLNGISAVWLATVALVIVYDVVGREGFGVPFHGTNEIVSNSVLSILFLQLPLSILTGGALRTTIVYGSVGRWGKVAINATSYGLALLLFLAIAVGSWPNMVEAWAIGELEGSGIIEIPVYPIRSLVVLVSIAGVAVSALMIHQAVFRGIEPGTAQPAFEGE